jgi:hypothetical protein
MKHLLLIITVLSLTVTDEAMNDGRCTGPPACDSIPKRFNTLRLGLVDFAHTELYCLPTADQRLGLLMVLVDSTFN